MKAMFIFAAFIVALYLIAIVVHPARREFRGLLARFRFVGRHFGAETGAINAFIPEIWSAMLLESLKKALVYGQTMVSNRNYEGEVANQGDTVRITSISRPTIATYTRGSTVISPEQLTDAQRTLIIDQAKYFAFEVDDVDARQAAGNLLDAAAVEAAYALADTQDQFIAALYTGAQSANQLGTVAVTTADLAYTQLRKLKVLLDNANVPTLGRYVVVPPWYEGLLLENDKFVRSLSEGIVKDSLLNGQIGRALGFDVLTSNNAPLVTGDDYAVMAGYPGAITVAEQINKTEAYRPQDAFSDALKGLLLYGAKLVRPDGIATVVASIT